MFLRQPKVNASITPSSKRAAREMVSGLDLGVMKYVVELGPGTGVFTDILYERLPKDCKVLLIELEEEYIQPLKEKYDDRFEVIKCSACQLSKLLMERGVTHVDLVISGLPYTLPNEVKDPLFNTLAELTQKGTCMRWFTYFPFWMKKHYTKFPLRKASFVAWNFPPMWIYTVN
ncbi:MAG: hypothetical protein COA49_05010 [Bacteroidetes bacterium]|nr:MAG: hypothetical protein COA49_05010 [Bacteroidota bacterium]